MGTSNSYGYCEFNLKFVDNGIILTILSQGLGSFKEPYNPGIYVFKNMQEAMGLIKEISNSAI